MPYQQIHQLAKKHLACYIACFIEVHMVALKHENKQGKPVSEKITDLIEFYKTIPKGERIGGTRLGVRQQAFWRLGSALIDAEQYAEVPRIMAEMSYTRSRKILAERLTAAQNKNTG